MEFLGKALNPSRHLKEQFVANLTGSSMLEISSLLTIVPALYLVRQAVGFKGVIGFNAMETSLMKNDDLDTASKCLGRYMRAMAVDFLSIVLPILLSFTILAEWAQLLAVLLVLLLISLIAVKRSSYSFRSEESSYRRNITSYRTLMMIATCLCILAVDFHIFPRRYAKTETYGTSLMDLGVGFFVVANSLVSRQARSIYSMKRWSTFQSASPLLFLGFARLLSTVGVNYQVHVGEYGVHWNFFFTLAAVSILTSLFNFTPNLCGLVGFIILIGYQICLMLGLNLYLLSTEREMGIISQNKEGIFSIFGYWGMYLIGVQCGNYLFFGGDSKTLSRSNKWVKHRVWLFCLLFWLLTLLLDKNVERVSRRMCNLPYVTFILALNLQVLAILMLSDFIPGRETLVIEEAFNHNLFGVFLLANLLTGMVNLFVDTLFATSVGAFAILFSYAFTLCVLSGLAHFYGIRFKFW